MWWLPLALACKRSPPATVEPTPTLAQATGSPDAGEPAPPPPPVPEPAPPAPPTRCLGAADCAPNEVCEGEGCADDQPGVCVGPGVRACTRDLRPYCGCDGATFTSSGLCPGRRYAHRGPCP